MENVVFRLPEVSAELKKTIEARLHTDRRRSPFIDQIRALRKKLTGVTSNPVYVVYDPKAEKSLAVKAGAMSAEDFIAFLKTEKKP